MAAAVEAAEGERAALQADAAALARRLGDVNESLARKVIVGGWRWWWWKIEAEGVTRWAQEGECEEGERAREERPAGGRQSAKRGGRRGVSLSKTSLLRCIFCRYPTGPHTNQCWPRRRARTPRSWSPLKPWWPC